VHEGVINYLAVMVTWFPFVRLRLAF